MSSKIIVDTIEKKTGDDVTLVGNLDVPTSYKITGTDADSIQAPGLITSAGGGLNTSLNTGLASATYPTKLTDRDIWYPIVEPGSHNSNNGSYLVSGTLDFSSGYISGCAPTGFTSVIGMKAYFISGTGPNSWTPFGVNWMISSSNGAARDEHSGSFNITTSGAFGDDKVRHIDIMNGNDNGSDFEDVIAENDVFGFKFTAPSMSQVLYGLGLKITWRF